jgi:hypothetical protein
METESVCATLIYWNDGKGLSGAGGFVHYSRRESFKTCALLSSPFKGCTNPEHHVVQATKLYTVSPNILVLST